MAVVVVSADVDCVSIAGFSDDLVWNKCLHVAGLMTLIVVLPPLVGLDAEVGQGVTVPYRPDKAASRLLWPVGKVEELLVCTLGVPGGIGMLGPPLASPCTGHGDFGSMVLSGGAVVVG